MRQMTSQSITSVARLLAMSLIIGMLFNIAYIQEGRALIRSWQGLNGDHYDVYHAMLDVKGVSEGSYDRITVLTSELSNHVDHLLASAEHFNQALFIRHQQDVRSGLTEYQLAIEDFKSAESISRNSIRYVLRHVSRLLSQSALWGENLHEYSTMR